MFRFCLFFGEPTLRHRKRRIEIHAAEDQEPFTLTEKCVPFWGG